MRYAFIAIYLFFAVAVAETAVGQEDHSGHNHAKDDDSGHDHSGHDHSSHQGKQSVHEGHDHSGHDHSGHDHSGHDHSSHAGHAHNEPPPVNIPGIPEPSDMNQKERARLHTHSEFSTELGYDRGGYWALKDDITRQIKIKLSKQELLECNEFALLSFIIDKGRPYFKN